MDTLILISAIGIGLFILFSVLENIMVKKGKMKKQEDAIERMIKNVNRASDRTNDYDSTN